MAGGCTTRGSADVGHALSIGPDRIRRLQESNAAVSERGRTAVVDVAQKVQRERCSNMFSMCSRNRWLVIKEPRPYQRCTDALSRLSLTTRDGPVRVIGIFTNDHQPIGLNRASTTRYLQRARYNTNTASRFYLFSKPPPHNVDVR